MENKKLITRQAVKAVLRDYAGQYRENTLATLLAFFLPAIGTVLVFYVPPLYVAKIVDRLASGSVDSVYDVLPFILLLGTLWFIGEMCWRAGVHALIKVDARGVNTLLRRMYQKLSMRDYDFYTDNFVGSLVKKGAAYGRNFEAFTDALAFNVVTNLIPIIFATVILWQYSPVIPMVLILCIVIATSIAIPIIRARAKLVAERHDAMSQLSGRLSDTLTNIFAIKSFAQEKTEGEVFASQADNYTTKYVRAANYQNLRLEAALSPVYVITNVIGLTMAVYFTLTLGLAVGATVVVFSYYSQISRIFWDISYIYRGIESSISEASEFTQMLLDEPTIKDALAAKDLKVKEGAVRFEDIHFAYDSEGEKKFMEGFNLEIKSNQKVGLVGPSGGGKTTVTKLILRFIEAGSGTVSIDGQDITKITQSSLREVIGYVPQEPLLFHRSLFENIAYGKSDATREEVIEASKIAHAHEFIESLPQGYETLVGERGVKLSGGQRQRVAIARALLKKAPILVLDEATSALDSESEKYIQEGLWELMKDKTALVIAHRLSTIKHLDRIIVLDKGAVVQDGTHDELIKQEGLYAKLWAHQSGEILEV